MKKVTLKPAKRSLVLSSAALCLYLAASTQNIQADELERCDEAEKAGKVLLIVKSDADCKLTVNNESHGMLAANQERIVEAPSGKQVTRCTSSDGAATQDESRLEEGCGSVTFEVASSWRRFTVQKNGVLDAETGLTWMQSDNGSDIDWNAARQYCAGKGGRLPSEAELRKFHTGGTVTSPCGEYSCKVSHWIRLSGRFLWTSSTFETTQAIIIGFASPKPAVQSADPAHAKDARALCLAGK